MKERVSEPLRERRRPRRKGDGTAGDRDPMLAPASAVRRLHHQEMMAQTVAETDRVPAAAGILLHHRLRTADVLRGRHKTTAPDNVNHRRLHRKSNRGMAADLRFDGGRFVDWLQQALLRCGATPTWRLP
jgi:hypothetical protein